MAEEFWSVFSSLWLFEANYKLPIYNVNIRQKGARRPYGETVANEPGEKFFQR